MYKFYECARQYQLRARNEMNYESGGWFVRVSNPTVLKPVDTVSLEYNGDVIFHWEGTVDQGGNVVEVKFARGYPLD